MAKDDIEPLPERPPRKRRQMEQALDIHLAMWAGSKTLTPSEYRRVVEERERRKRLKVSWERLGLLVGSEGITPPQTEALTEFLASQQGRLTAIWHTRVAGSIHSLCKAHCDTVNVVGPWLPRKDQWQIVVKNSTKLIAFPRGDVGGEVWEMVRFARHRSTPVTIVMPNGERR